MRPTTTPGGTPRPPPLFGPVETVLLALVVGGPVLLKLADRRFETFPSAVLPSGAALVRRGEDGRTRFPNYVVVCERDSGRKTRQLMAEALKLDTRWAVSIAQHRLGADPMAYGGKAAQRVTEAGAAGHPDRAPTLHWVAERVTRSPEDACELRFEQVEFDWRTGTHAPVSVEARIALPRASAR